MRTRLSRPCKAAAAACLDQVLVHTAVYQRTPCRPRLPSLPI